MNKETCESCRKVINKEKDKYVLLGTYNNGKPMKETYRHFECWVQYWNEQLVSKIQKSMGAVTQNLPGMMKNMLKGMEIKVENGR